MTIPTVKTDVYTDFQGLSSLRAKARSEAGDTLKEVADQFEALFIQMMLKSMREANLGEGILDNDQTSTYQAMFDKQIAIELSKGRGLGLSDMIVQQLGSSGISANYTSGTYHTPNTADMENREYRSGQAIPENAVTTDLGVQQSTPEWKPATPEAFVTDLWPHAKRAAQSLGATPEALLAQAALETGWGRRLPTGVDGRNSFNLFGIKADSGWRGERIVTETIEYRDGLVRKEKAHFRAYTSLAESFNDYTEFLRVNPRYREALATADDAPAFTRALAQAGYATDPEYSQKINKIMASERFRDALGVVKQDENKPLI